MGYYLNSTIPFGLYQRAAKKRYFVDKSDMIATLLPLAEEGDNHICITRPRRFGKSVMAQMISAFFTKGIDSSCIFDNLKIADHPMYREYLNQYNVIYINFLRDANDTGSYNEFITRVKNTIQSDVREAFSTVEFSTDGTAIQDLIAVTEQTGESFILIMDEWDCIFHKDYTTDNDRRSFIDFLSALTKDAGYIALTYMTGILPIAKYSSGSSINHFAESHLAEADEYSEFFGFTDSEVDELYERYTKNVKKPAVTRESLTAWYDGYQIGDEKHLYNPRSVVMSLTKNRTGSYWTQTGSFSELTDYISNDVDGVRLAVAQMVAGESVPVIMQEYAAGAMRLDTRDRILSAMVIYGFLTYDKSAETVRIPNRELLKEFKDTILTEPGSGYIYRLAKASDKILQATLDKDAAAVAKELEDVHNDTPIKAYNSEAELCTVVYFAYLSALDTYEVRREEQAGKGYADFIFMPRDGKKDGIIIELKKDKTPEEAIQQIKDKHYIDAFRGRLGEKQWNGNRILAVGITYDSKSGEHHCKIEELELE